MGALCVLLHHTLAMPTATRRGAPVVMENIPQAGAGTSGVSAAAPGPTVHADETFDVKIQRGVNYALGVLCDTKPCAPGDKVGVLA